MLLAACGRVGFDVSVDSGLGDATGGGDGPPMSDGPSGSVTYTFGEAPATMIKNVTRDTYISNEAEEALLNYGADDEVRLERDANERGLLAFDLAMLPPAATVLSATLQITVTQIPPTPSAIDLHPLLESWDQGNQAGGSGVANYITRSGASSWSSAGAGQPSSSGPAVAQFTPALGIKTIPLPASLISDWVTGPNHGLVLISTNDESTRFATSEAMPLPDRPILTVTFVP